MIEFAKMTTIEQFLSILFAISVVITILSAFMVYKNESEEIKQKTFLRELLGGLDVFVTSRYLNEQGKIWRVPFLIGMVYIIFWVIYFLDKTDDKVADSSDQIILIASDSLNAITSAHISLLTCKPCLKAKNQKISYQVQN